MKKAVPVFIGALLLVVMLAACGGGGAVESTTTTVAATGETVAPVTATSVAATTVTTEAVMTTEAPATTEAKPKDLGKTQDSPVPLGTEVQVGDWKIKVVSYTADATTTLLKANMFNEKPAAGEQYSMVALAATYTGEKSGTFWVDISAKLLGTEGNTFDSAGVAPKPITDANEAFPNAKVAGNISYLIPTNQADDALLILEASFSFDSTRVFMALK